MRHRSILVAATGASVLMIGLVSAATAFVVLNHEEKAKVVGGLTIDDGSAEESAGGDHDRSLVMRMADALAARLLQGWEGHTARIAGSGGVGTGGPIGAGGGLGTSVSGDVLGALIPQSALTPAQNTGLRLGPMTFGAYGESGPTFMTALAMPRGVPGAGVGGGNGVGGGSGSGGGDGGASGGGEGGGGAPTTPGGPAPVVDEGRLQLPAPPVTPPGPLVVVPLDVPGNAGPRPGPGPGPQPPSGGANPPAPPFSPIVPGPDGGQVVEDLVPAQVPEPATLALLGGALSTLAVGAAWRRRRHEG